MPHTRSQAPSPGGFLSLETHPVARKRTALKTDSPLKDDAKPNTSTPMSKKPSRKGNKRGRKPSAKRDDSLSSVQSIEDMETGSHSESHNGSDASGNHGDTKVEDNSEHPGFSTPIFCRTQTQGTQTPNTAVVAGRRLYEIALEALASSPIPASQMIGEDFSVSVADRLSVKTYHSVGTQTSPDLNHALYTAAEVQTSPSLDQVQYKDAELQTEWASDSQTHARNFLCCPCCAAPVSCPAGHQVGAHLEPKSLAIIQRKLTPIPAYKKNKKRILADIESENDEIVTQSQKRRLVAPPGSTSYTGRAPIRRAPTTHAERRRKYTMPKDGSHPPTIFGLSQVLAAEKEKKQTAPTVASNSANESSASNLFAVQDDLNAPDRSASPSRSVCESSVPNSHASPSTWNFRELFGSVPRSISKLFLNPFAAMRPESEHKASFSTHTTPTKKTDISRQVETPSYIKPKSGLFSPEEYWRRFGGLSSEPETVKESTQTNPQQRSEGSKTARSEPSTISDTFHKGPDPKVSFPTFPSKIDVPQTVYSNGPSKTALQPTPKTKKSNKRKRLPSPDIIPNPKGCSYGMDLDYFPPFSDSDEESSDSGSEKKPQDNVKPSAIIHDQRPPKRVRFDASPQDTPSKLRLSAAAVPASQYEPRFISSAERRAADAERLALSGTTEPYATQLFAASSDPFARPVGQHPSHQFAHRPCATDPYHGRLFAEPIDSLRRVTEENTRNNSLTGYINRQEVFSKHLPSDGPTYVGAPTDDNAPLGHDAAGQVTRPSPPADSISTAWNLPNAQPANLVGPASANSIDVRRTHSADLQPTESTSIAPSIERNFQPSVIEEEALSSNEPEITRPSEKVAQEIPVTRPSKSTFPPEIFAKVRSEAEKYKPKTPSTLRESRRNSSPSITSPQAKNMVPQNHDVLHPDAKWLLDACPSGNLNDLVWPDPTNYADLVGGDTRLVEAMNQIWDKNNASDNVIPFEQIIEHLGVALD